MTTDDYQLDTTAADAELKQAGPGGGKGADKRIFKPKPFKDGQTYCNRLFVALIRPKLVQGFERYPLDHKLFYVKLMGHYMPTGPKSQEFVLCKVQHNKQAADLAKDPSYKMFDDDRCPSCEDAQIVWDQYTARWAELGYPDKESRKSLSKEEYKKLSSDPQLEAMKTAAMTHQFKVRYALPVYDIEQQPLQKGYQWCFAPESVFKGLMELVRVGLRFYSLNPHASNPDAIEGSEIFVNKDTTKGARFCEYSVTDNRAPLCLAAEEVVYLKNAEAELPPLLELVSVWEYDAHKQFVMAGVVADGENVPGEAAETVPQSVARPAPRSVAPQAPARFAPAPARSAPAPQASAPAATVARPVAPRPAPARSVAAPQPVAASVVETAPAGASITPPAVVSRPVASAPQVAPPVGVAPPVAAGGQAPRPRRTW